MVLHLFKVQASYIGTSRTDLILARSIHHTSNRRNTRLFSKQASIKMEPFVHVQRQVSHLTIIYSANKHALRSVMHLLRLLIIIASVATMPVHAKEAACIDAGAGDSECVMPLLSAWDTWRFVLNETVGPARDDEATALADAIALLGESFRCGLSYTQENTAYVTTAKRWSWTTQEESTVLQYVGLADSTNRNCTGQLLERAGSIRIRRERKISCPRHFNWLIQGEKPGVCVRD